MSEPKSNVVWCYSDEASPEAWPNHCLTRDEAIAEVRAEYPGKSFYVASGYKQSPNALFADAEAMIEWAEERASEEVEDGNEFVHVADGGKEALDAFLDEWLAKCVRVEYWIVDGDSELIESEAS